MEEYSIYPPGTSPCRPASGVGTIAVLMARLPPHGADGTFSLPSACSCWLSSPGLGSGPWGLGARSLTSAFRDPKPPTAHTGQLQ